MSSAKRIFTYEEALSLLPEVQRLTAEAVATVEQTSGADEDESDGIPPESQEIVADWARSIAEMGIEVKGLWLIDFDSGSGYYCWRYPEESLQYFHGYDEGFTGRVRLN